VAINEGKSYNWFTPERIKENNRAQALNNLHMIDVKDPRCPVRELLNFD